ncbi:hypothetical protein GCM10023342_16040 [Modicisalibacter zincidurans]|uniref:Secreted protein n=1 Tax=Modicisalibacter zincidurans TaxID=1178777 RepID=A0ABP9RBL2_9GAMM
MLAIIAFGRTLPGALVACLRLPDVVDVLGDLVHGAVAGDAAIVVVDFRRLDLRVHFVMALDHQPVLVALLLASGHSGQRPGAAQLFAVEGEVDAVPVALSGRLPAAAIPQHDRAAAVGFLRDDAFEVAVIQGVVLDLDGQALFAGSETGALGQRPTLEHAVLFEAQVEMVVAGGVLVHHVALAAR